MKKVRVIANYLPQFHETPQNNKWWGQGYTDWVAVKKSKPLFDGHRQPRVPENGYYSLDQKEVIAWQAEIARENGVDAFGIYHYWFSSDLRLLEKPAEILRDSPDINIGYLFIWDNSNWRRTWSNVRFGNDWAPKFEGNGENSDEDRGILAELKYGSEKEWREHFEYLLRFFTDKRYVKVDNRPVFCFFNPDNDSETLKRMCEYWDQLAREHGFSGVHIIEQRKHMGGSISKYGFTYEPPYHGWYSRTFAERVAKRILKELRAKINKPLICDYDKIWKRIIGFADKCKDENLYYGAFVGYDDSPRRGGKGTIVKGESPEKFERYMKKLLDISSGQRKEFVFITAWNEWGEGAYLEPDTVNGMAYLDALRRSVCEKREVE